MSSTDYTTLTVRERDKQVFEQALDAVASEIGEKPTRSQALRELSEAYIGHQPRGQWRNGTGETND